MILTRLIVPKERNEETEKLYFRGRKISFDKDNGVVLSEGQIVTLDTYFNGFFYSPFLRFTKVEDVNLVLKTKGQLKVRIVCVDIDDDPVILEERIIEADGETVFDRVDLKSLPENGVVYPEIEAISSVACIQGGYYETTCPQMQDVKLAVGICTYKREEYVLRNIDNVNREIWEDENNPIKDEIHFFVIDNGHTLPSINNPNVTLLENRNYGGSGGFTRALMEIHYQKDKYTHFLLMDDDLTFETEILLRTVQFMKVADNSEQPVYIGGQMLRESKPMIQHEAGAKYKRGYAVAQGSGYKLWTIYDLLRNCNEKIIEFNAWWYCCMPIGTIDENGLPLPLFIRNDDIEYGLRSKGRFAVMNGIGVWHADFQNKTSKHLDYYATRNSLIVISLHKDVMKKRDILAFFTKNLMWAFEKGDMTRANFVFRAVNDYLKGPEFLFKTDEEKLNKELMEAKKHEEVISGSAYAKFICKYCWNFARLSRGFTKTKQKYKNAFEILTSFDFWEEHLGLK